MAGSILVAGHTSVDVVSAPTGQKTQPGGAALYAAMAAKIFNDDVRLVTAIGRDYQYRETLRKFPRSNIIVTKTKSCRFEIQYDDNWRADYRKSEFGAARFLRARNVISAATGCSYVHLAPMPPEKVSAIVRGIKEKNGPSISVNSWEGYMKRKTDRKTLRDLAPLVDFFIVNEREAIQLTEVNNIAQAVRSLPAKQLVVTLGELGAIHLKEGKLNMIPPSAWFAGKTVDTTGAGDVWCGAFIGAYSVEEDVWAAVSAASTISALRCRGWNFEKIENLRFNSVGELVTYALSLRGGGQLTLTRYLR